MSSIVFTTIVRRSTSVMNEKN